MKKYTVRDTATGKNVTFAWDGPEPPTDKDMQSVFAAASKRNLGRVGTDDWLPESYGGIPKWGLKNPALWGARGAGLELYDKAIQPTLEALGMAGGSLASPVVGTAIGYGAGKKTGEIGRGFLERAGMPEELQRRQKTVGEEFVQSGKDIGTTLAIGGAFKGASRVMRPIDDKITAAIGKGMNKGVKPSTAGKYTFSQRQSSDRLSEDAVKSIVKNKNNLNLTDEFGDVSKGLPKNLRQFSQAIEQTKQGVFKQYNELTKLAGDKGALVDTASVIKGLREFVGNKALQKVSPETIKYARGLIDRFSVQPAGISTQTMGGTRQAISAKIPAEEAQEIIKGLNVSLESFYKNQTYDTAKRAYVDQLVANNVRKSLDNTIMRATGKHYQVLKNKYGALKSIEKDVSHRAVVDARKSPKGLVDFSDVFSGYHAAKGILTMDPATLGAAGTSKAVSWLYRTKNQPNRLVKNMFSDVDRLMSKQGATAEAVAAKPAPKSKTPPPQRNRKPIYTGSGEVLPRGKFTDMGTVKPRIPTSRETPKRYKIVREHGTGSPKIVELKDKEY